MFAVFFVRLRSTTFHIIFGIIFALCFARFSGYFRTILCPIFPRGRADIIFYTIFSRSAARGRGPSSQRYFFPPFLGDRNPRMLSLKKSLLAVQAFPRPPQDGSQVGPQNLQLWRPKLGSILGGVLDHPGAARQIFGGPSCPAQMGPPPKIDL